MPLLITKVLLILTAALFLFKLILFLIQKSNRWSIGDFFYFGHSHFTHIPDTKGASKKHFHNTLSIILLVLICILAFCLYIATTT